MSTGKNSDFVKSPSAALRFNFVVAAYWFVRFTPQFLRALHMELFTKSLVLVSYLPRKKRLSIQSILDMFLDMFPKMRFPSNHSVKGGDGRFGCWPGGSGGTRRKHRSG